MTNGVGLAGALTPFPSPAGAGEGRSVIRMTGGVGSAGVATIRRWAERRWNGSFACFLACLPACLLLDACLLDAFAGSGRVPVGLAVFKTVAGRCTRPGWVRLPCTPASGKSIQT